MMMYLLSLLTATVVAVIAVTTTCHAFQPVSRTVQVTAPNRVSSLELFQAKPTFSFAGKTKKKNNNINKKKTVAKKKNNKNKGKVEEEEVKSKGANLILAYMTPWRNPNSIFVYMFGLLYALGKYSESH
mmetsp:Transcript_15921/g.20213  ORF Transcript_15921/g.20213 Transcript_15921/m.20213 type:complete len:129 (+) Transcript_15921:84-470(+)|eukprot:CAMPEP_0203641430 /NCGR_PEP_ID=MMETSP0088-20131115/6743_1 /ASSEMBLY_ACC=CAM_ASM_001087 /TAXON_ID=426623 /ORGANISM="Chaetoceros affinis, Strain CCMP159" /LENGTH=128 /DNA_ID=CAMNT_0050496867 /DNA_START=39 /DNA_END=425 /DNA_ORIENTATION=+